MSSGSGVKPATATTRLFLATAILAGLGWSLLECLDLQVTGAVRFALARQWPLLWLADLSIGVAAGLALATVFELGTQLTVSVVRRWRARPELVTAAVLFAVHGLVWVAACHVGLFHGRAAVTGAGLVVLGALAWAARGPLPWRPGVAVGAHGRWAALGWLVALALHLFNRGWNSKIYFPLHVAASIYALTAALWATAHLLRARARPRLERPLGVGVPVGTVLASFALPALLLGVSNDVRHVLFTRAFDAKSLLYVARKVRGAGYRQATAMPAPEAVVAAPGQRRVQRVLFISMDTVRADHLPTYGYARDTAPEIARLAHESTVFDWAWSAGSHTSLALHAIFGSVAGQPPLTQVLAQAKIPHRAVLARAFVQYAGGFEHVDVPDALGDAGIAEAAAREIAAGRFDGLLWVHFFDAHRPYDRHPGIDFGTRPIDLYDGEIRSSDRAVGRVLRALDEAHLADSTAVVLVADHGEEFGEHGGEAHGWDLYDELLRVPLVVHVPGLAPKRVRDHVTQRDLPLTIADLLGVGQVPGRADRSLVPLLFGQASADDRATLVGPLSSFDVGALMAGRWKLIYCLFNDSRALYDLAADPAEDLNLYEARPAVARRLEELLQRGLGDLPRAGAPLLARDADLRWP